MAEIQYLDGNVNSPVAVHGDDPTNTDNVLVTRLGTTESVPKESVTEQNEDPDGTVDESKDAQIASLTEQLETANASKE